MTLYFVMNEYLKWCFKKYIHCSQNNSFLIYVYKCCCEHAWVADTWELWSATMWVRINLFLIRLKILIMSFILFLNKYCDFICGNAHSNLIGIKFRWLRICEIGSGTQDTVFTCVVLRLPLWSSKRVLLSGSYYYSICKPI